MTDTRCPALAVVDGTGRFAEHPCEHEWLMEGTTGERWFYCHRCKERVLEKPK